MACLIISIPSLMILGEERTFAHAPYALSPSSFTSPTSHPEGSSILPHVHSTYDEASSFSSPSSPYMHNRLTRPIIPGNELFCSPPSPAVQHALFPRGYGFRVSTPTTQDPFNFLKAHFVVHPSLFVCIGSVIPSPWILTQPGHSRETQGNLGIFSSFPSSP